MVLSSLWWKAAKPSGKRHPTGCRAEERSDDQETIEAIDFEAIGRPHDMVFSSLSIGFVLGNISYKGTDFVLFVHIPYLLI